MKPYVRVISFIAACGEGVILTGRQDIRQSATDLPERLRHHPNSRFARSLLVTIVTARIKLR
jgi:hypothetical protein